MDAVLQDTEAERRSDADSPDGIWAKFKIGALEVVASGGFYVAWLFVCVAAWWILKEKVIELKRPEHLFLLLVFAFGVGTLFGTSASRGREAAAYRQADHYRRELNRSIDVRNKREDQMLRNRKTSQPRHKKGGTS